MPHFWSPKIDKKVINSSTKCLISVKIAILTPHIITPPLVMFGWYLICRNMSTDFVFFWKSIHAFKDHMSFVWIYSQLQIHTMLYVHNSPVTTPWKRWTQGNILVWTSTRIWAGNIILIASPRLILPGPGLSYSATYTSVPGRQRSCATWL